MGPSGFPTLFFLDGSAYLHLVTEFLDRLLLSINLLRQVVIVATRSSIRVLNFSFYLWRVAVIYWVLIGLDSPLIVNFTYFDNRLHDRALLFLGVVSFLDFLWSVVHSFTDCRLAFGFSLDITGSVHHCFPKENNTYKNIRNLPNFR